MLNNCISRLNIISLLNVYLLQQMLRYDPSKRITAADAMKHPYFDDLSPAIVHN